MFKRILYIIISLSALYACSREDLTRLTITARPEGASTKTVLQENRSVSFDVEDHIAVFDGNMVKKDFTITKIYDDGSADFAGMITEPATSYIAVYPYGNDCQLFNDDVIVTIPTIQKAVPGSFDPAAGISVGRTGSIFSDTHTLEMKNVCSLVKFSVPEGTSYSTAILFQTDQDVYLTGQMRCTVSDEPAIVPVYGECFSNVTLQGEITGGNWYYMAVCPAVLNGGFALYLFDKTVTIENIADYSTVKATDKKITLKRSEILNIGIIGAEPGASFAPIDGETTFVW